MRFRSFGTSAVFGFVLACFSPLYAGGPGEARKLLDGTQHSASVSPSDTNMSEAESLFATGREYYMRAEFKKAASFFKSAVQLAPKNGEYLDWLGRAYSRRSELSEPITAISLAERARKAFEAAVALDPQNSEALADLFESYIDPPLGLRAKYEKAEMVAEKMSSIDSFQASLEMARLGRKAHQPQTTEEISSSSLR